MLVILDVFLHERTVRNGQPPHPRRHIMLSAVHPVVAFQQTTRLSHFDSNHQQYFMGDRLLLPLAPAARRGAQQQLLREMSARMCSQSLSRHRLPAVRGKFKFGVHTTRYAISGTVRVPRVTSMRALSGYRQYAHLPLLAADISCACCGCCCGLGSACGSCAWWCCMLTPARVGLVTR